MFAPLRDHAADPESLILPGVGDFVKKNIIDGPESPGA
jgi:hypothetical protein